MIPELGKAYPEELASYGWTSSHATRVNANGSVPDDDQCWSGNYTGQVRAILLANRVMMEGQLLGIGPGMRKYAERRVGTSPFSEVLFTLFRLPPPFSPQAVHSYSRRLLDTSRNTDELMGGYADGQIGYRPLRRIDVLPNGYVVLVACLLVKTELRKAFMRQSRWLISLDRVDFFLNG
eukprot:g77880.t1